MSATSRNICWRRCITPRSRWTAITHPLSAMTCTAAEIGGERLAGRNHAENPCALCGGQQNDRPALAAGHEEGAGGYGEAQEKSPTPARQADAPPAYEA